MKPTHKSKDTGCLYYVDKDIVYFWVDGAETLNDLLPDGYVWEHGSDLEPFN